MLIRSFDNRPRLTGFAVFADPGMQGIRIDTQLLGGLSDRLIGFNRQLDGGFPEFRWIDFWFFFTHFGHPFFCSFYFSLCVRFSVASSRLPWQCRRGHERVEALLFHLDAEQRPQTAPQIGGHGGSERNDDREQGIDEKGGAFLAQIGF